MWMKLSNNMVASVDNATKSATYSIIDGFSGYNQIRMKTVRFCSKQLRDKSLSKQSKGNPGYASA
jgi:hypothetical protein